MKKSIILFLCLFFLCTAQSQDCTFSPTNNGVNNLASAINYLNPICVDSKNYTPYTESHDLVPIKRLKVVFHFIRNNQGGGNFANIDLSTLPANPHSAFWQTVVADMNFVLAGLQPMNLTHPLYPSQYIQDSRIRLVISDILYIIMTIILIIPLVVILVILMQGMLRTFMYRNIKQIITIKTTPFMFFILQKAPVIPLVDLVVKMAGQTVQLFTATMLLS